MTDKLSKSGDKRLENLSRNGRPKGVPNKSTSLAREAIAKFVDGNSDKLQEWLDAIAVDERYGPLEAFKCFMQVTEYHVPKLARQELVGDETAPVKIEVSWADD